jgi:hypothetical protein
MLMNGVTPIPPAMKIAGRERLLWSISDPDGPSSRTCSPIGRVFRVRLNALSRMRVAMVSSGSEGALTRENV